MSDRSANRWRNLISGRQTGVAASIARGALRVLSWLYGTGRRLHRKSYEWGWRQAERLPKPVVSIGNLTVGGVGKTPFVAWLAQRLQAEQLRPVVLARGYGRKHDQALNEEGRWLTQVVPGLTVLQDSDRAAMAKSYLAQHTCDLFLLDDGFQHERLARSLDIVLLDATGAFGFDALLPRGLLRESPHALKRAQFVLLSRAEQASAETLQSLQTQILQWAPAAKIGQIQFPIRRLRNREDTVESTWLAQQRVLLVSGVGNPEAVLETVVRLGADVIEHRVFADHHLYDRKEVDSLVLTAKNQDLLLVTTAKDAIKLDGIVPADIGPWILEQDCVVDGCVDELLQTIMGLVGR